MDFDHSTDTITADATTDPLRVGGTAGFVVPSGTTAQRPAAQDGIFRYNSDTACYEICRGTTWTPIQDSLSTVTGSTWIFSTTTTTADPGSRFFRCNNATLASVTELYISETTAASLGIGSSLAMLKSGDKIIIQQKSDFSRNAIFQILSTPVDNGTWWTFTVSVSVSATLFSNNSECSIQFSILSTERIDVLESNVQGLVIIDMLGGNYTMTREESLNGLIAVTNPGTGSILTLHDAIDNPSIYTIIACGVITDPTFVFSCCSGTMNFNITQGYYTSVIYGFGLGAADIIRYVPYINDDLATPGPANRVYRNTFGTSVKTIDMSPYVRVATDSYLNAYYVNSVDGSAPSTLTNGGPQVALAIDSVALNVNDRVLVKDQIDFLENGVYIVTNVGSGSTNWVLTRSADYNNQIAGSLRAGNIMYVGEGFYNAETSWIQKGTGSGGSGNIVLGTDGVIYTPNVIGVSGSSPAGLAYILDFGSIGEHLVQTVVSYPAISSSDRVLCSLAQGGDMTAEEAAIQGITVTSYVQAGVGFTLYGAAPNGATGIIDVIAQILPL